MHGLKMRLMTACAVVAVMAGSASAETWKMQTLWTAENGGEKVGHGSGGMSLLRAA